MGSTKLQEWTITEPWLNIHCKLGEGPYFEPKTKTLRFVDIMNHRLHTVPIDLKTPTDKDVTTIQLDGPVTMTADIEGVDPSSKILIGLKYGLAALDRKSGKYEYVAKFAGQGEKDNERLRSNDGAADPNGRMWLGTMTDWGQGDFKYEGGFHLISNGKSSPVIKDLMIPNSVSFSPDNRIFYYTDSTGKTMYALDYDVAAGGTTSNKRVFYKHNGTGDPDGHRIDSEGNMWFTIYGEYKVLKISPEGKLVGQITLPTKNITCCEFVGTELLITTANDDENVEDKRSKELGGAVYRVDVGVTGLKPFEYKM